MLLLFDNDLLWKLCYYNLFDAFLQAVGSGSEDMRLLGTGKHWVQSRMSRSKYEEWRSGFDPVGLERMVQLASELRDMNDLDFDEQAASAMNGIEGIDPGEAVLFATGLANSEAIICTGDKRAIRAYATEFEAGWTGASNLDGRVICFEEAVLQISRSASWRYLLPVLRSRKPEDKTVDIWIGSDRDLPSEKVEQNIRAYLAELSDQTNHLVPSRLWIPKT